MKNLEEIKNLFNAITENFYVSSWYPTYNPRRAHTNDEVTLVEFIRMACPIEIETSGSEFFGTRSMRYVDAEGCRYYIFLDVKNFKVFEKNEYDDSPKLKERYECAVLYSTESDKMLIFVGGTDECLPLGHCTRRCGRYASGRAFVLPKVPIMAHNAEELTGLGAPARPEGLQFEKEVIIDLTRE